MSVICLAGFGAIGAVGYTDDRSVKLQIDLPPENWETSDDDGWEPPALTVTVQEDDGPTWYAGGGVVSNFEDLDGLSQVDSYSMEGATASGTATFIDFAQYHLAMADMAEDPEPVTGTFEVSCAS